MGSNGRNRNSITSQSQEFPDELRDRRKPGWFWMFNQVFEMDLSPYAILVYTYLCRKARGSVAMPSIREMARVLKLKHYQIYGALKELEERNMVKREQVKDGSRLLNNRYILTDLKEWVMPCSNGTPVLYEHPCSNRTPPVLYEHLLDTGNSENVDTQGEENAEPSYRTTNNRTTNKDYYISPPYNKGGGGEKEIGLLIKSFESEEKTELKDKRKQKTKSKISPNKPSAFENSAGRRPAEDPERIYRELLEKWEPYLKNVKLRRLSRAQAVFFLENSSLSPEKTLRVILKDDGNDRIANPVGTIYRSLPMKPEVKHAWLLKVDEEEGHAGDVETEEWYLRYVRKKEGIKKLFEKWGLKFEDREVRTEEEAQEHLKILKERALKVLWDRAGEEREKLKRKFGHLKEDIFWGAVADRLMGRAQALFSLYTD